MFEMNLSGQTLIQTRGTWNYLQLTQKKVLQSFLFLSFFFFVSILYQIFFQVFGFVYLSYSTAWPRAGGEVFFRCWRWKRGKNEWRKGGKRKQRWATPAGTVEQCGNCAYKIALIILGEVAGILYIAKEKQETMQQPAAKWRLKNVNQRLCFSFIALSALVFLITYPFAISEASEPLNWENWIFTNYNFNQRYRLVLSFSLVPPKISPNLFRSEEINWWKN